RDFHVTGVQTCALPIYLQNELPVEDARQFILQMYLIDHALDCPTCDKSGECYLQDNTYLNNVNTNPYRRPKFVRPYVHFSDLIEIGRAPGRETGMTEED